MTENAPNPIELRKNIPATLKTFTLAIEDGMNTPIDKLDIEAYLMRQANTLDTVSRVMLAHSLADPAKASPVMIRTALDAMQMCGKTLSRLNEINWHKKAHEEHHNYGNIESAERTIKET